MFAIYSCEGFSREVLPSLRRQYGPDADVVFVDDDEKTWGSEYHGCEVISFEQLKSGVHRDRSVCVGIADPESRRSVVEKCEAAGFSFFSVADPSNTTFDNIAVGEGAILCAHTTLTGDATIGQHFHCNIYSYVAHDCIIGDYVTFAPKVCCNGRVVIDDMAYIGTGAIIRQGAEGRPTRIGEGAVVGMGSVVLEDVPAGAVVVGNPARVIRVNER